MKGISDIHIEVEAKFKRNLSGLHPCFNPNLNSVGTWVWVKTGHFHRNTKDQKLIDILIGIENAHNRISDLKGIPHNISVEVKGKIASWDNTTHHTWYTAKELIEFSWKAHPNNDFISKFVLTELPFYGLPEDVRLVIWLDLDG